MTTEPDKLIQSIRRKRERYADWLRQGEPSVGRNLAQIGVLGWTIVVPTLAALFLGRWIDRTLGTGIFWSGPLMLLGLAMGCWTAWQWMHNR